MASALASYRTAPSRKSRVAEIQWDDDDGVQWDVAPTTAPEPKARPHVPESSFKRYMRPYGQALVGAGQMMSGIVAGAAEALPDGAAKDYLQRAPIESQGLAQEMRENAEAANPPGLDYGDAQVMLSQTVASAPAQLRVMGAAKAAAPFVQRAATALANRTASGAAGGAALANTNEASLGENMTVGAVAANAVPGVTGAISGAVRGKAADSAAQRLARKGVSLTPGQIVGGAAKRGEDAMSSVPILGAAVQSSQRKGMETFNSAALNEVLAPIGESMPKGYIGRAAIAQANKKLSTAYGELLGKVAAKEDPAFRADLTRLKAFGDSLPPRQKQLYQFILKNELAGKFVPGGVVRGEALKRIESNLGTLAVKYGKSQDPYDNQMADGVREAQSALRELLARNNPQHADRLKAINSSYAMFLRVQRASRMAGSKKGVFSPEALRSSVGALDQSKNKGATARGAATMQKFAEDAEEVLGNKVPNSGTADRVMLGTLLAGAAGGSAALPAIAPGVGAAMIPYLPGGRQAMQALLMRRPAAAARLADSLESAGAASAPAAIPLSHLLFNGGP